MRPSRPIAESCRSALRRSRLLRRAVVVSRHRGVGSADAFLASYPKSGNTWLRFMLTHLLTGEEAQFTVDSAGSAVPEIGAHRRSPRCLPGGGRLIKSHEPYRAVYGHRYRKVVYVVRDGRDVAVSYYYALLRRGERYADFSDFLRAFLAGRVEGYGSWRHHVESWLDSAKSPSRQMHLVRYEDMLRDPSGELAAAAGFLGLDGDDGAISEAIKLNAPARMRERWEGSELQAGQGHKDISFVRTAGAGGWRDVFTSIDEKRFWSDSGALLTALGYCDEASRGREPTDE